MAGNLTVKVEGLRQLERALKQADADAAKGLRKELREAARLVSLEARSRFIAVSPYSAMGMVPRVRSGLVAVAEQRRKRTTGKRPDYGALQMRRAFLPALADKQPEVMRRVENMLDNVSERFN